MTLADDLRHVQEVEELRGALMRTQRQLSQAKQRSDHLVTVVERAARDAVMAMGPVAAVPAPKADRRTRKPEVALWCLGDWQGAKRTATYNSTVMRQRVMRFADVAEEITGIQRADHPVREATVLFLGDMVEGLFNFPTQPFEIDATIFEQYVTVSRLLVDVVRRALAVYDRVQVVAEWGNHGRIGSKRDAVPRSDNVDRMCYELARQLLAGEKRLTWEDCPNDVQQVEIGTYRALAIHGDEVGRSGYVSRSTMVSHVHKWRAGAWPWTFRDVYVGHYHTHAEEPLSNGEGAVYWCGSTESDNRYARDGLASCAVPSQRLHFIDPDKGRVSAQHKVWL